MRIEFRSLRNYCHTYIKKIKDLPQTSSYDGPIIYCVMKLVPMGCMQGLSTWSNWVTLLGIPYKDHPGTPHSRRNFSATCSLGTLLSKTLLFQSLIFSGRVFDRHSQRLQYRQSRAFREKFGNRSHSFCIFSFSTKPTDYFLLEDFFSINKTPPSGTCQKNVLLN